MDTTQFDSSSSRDITENGGIADSGNEILRDADTVAYEADSRGTSQEQSSQGQSNKELPDGIMRIGQIALACGQRLSSGLRQACDSYGLSQPHSETRPVKLAVFDFDKTSINGNSPVMLVRELIRRGMLRGSVIARILVWALAYRLRLPQNESWARSLVFSAFNGQPVCEVNAFLWRFYDEKIAPLFRAPMVRIMQDHIKDGHVVVCLSATFEPIIAQAMCEQPIQFGIATRMHIDENGCYTNRVEGLPVEGTEKVSVLTKFADSLFGKDGWELGWAYGDHHSDSPLLAAAEHGIAVMPDKPLARTAEQEGYEILHWNTK